MSFAHNVKRLGKAGGRVRLLPLIAYILVSYAPLIVTAQNSCVEIFTPWGFSQPLTSVQSTPSALSRPYQISTRFREIIQQITLKKRRFSDVTLTVELVREAREFLRRTGVEHIENSDVFYILPSQKTALNREALRIQEVYGAETMFYPRQLVGDHSGGFVGFITKQDGSSVPALGIGAATLFRQERFLRDEEFLHELRHLRLVLDILNKVASPFYGNLIAEIGRIPDAVNPELQGYRTFMSFEELRTYQASLAYTLFELSHAVKSGQASKQIQKRLENTYNRILYLYTIASRTLQTVPKLVELLDSGAIQPEFTELKGIVYGTVKSLKIDGNALTLELPLVSSIAVTDPFNVRFFRQQLLWLQQSAELILNTSYRYGQLVASIKDTNPSPRVILTTIAEIRRTLPKLKHGTSRPELPFSIQARIWLREKIPH